MKNQLLIFVICAGFISCNGNKSKYQDYAESENRKSILTDSTNSVVITSDATQTFVYTSDLKFKVKDILKSTSKFENAARQVKGYVQNTRLNRNVIRENTHSFKDDSLLVSQQFQMVNDLVIRIPVSRLDTFLRIVGNESTMLEYRIINAENVTPDLFVRELQSETEKNRQTRLEKFITSKQGKVNEHLEAEKELTNTEQNSVFSISNAFRQDYAIRYATVNLQIYESPKLQREVVLNPDYIDQFRPGFIYEFNRAALAGWNILQTLILFFIHIWPLLLIILIAYWVFKKRILRLSTN